MKGFCILFLILLFGAAFALPSDELNWNGFGQIYMSKEVFDTNQSITGSLYLTNLEAYPLLDGKIVLQITEGDYSYPSQFSSGNIVSESIISNIWTLPNTTKRIDFNLPPQKAGNYRLDIYAWAVKSKLIGASNILYNPLSENFSVKGTEDKRVIIDRTKTVFGKENVSGQTGFTVNSGEEFSGKVVVRNDSKVQQKNLVLSISFCDWATAFCANPTEENFSLASISAGEEKTIDVSLTAPIISSVYEINIVLKNASGKSESIYKNRLIVSGPTAKIRKVFISGIEKKEYKVTAVISGLSDGSSEIAFDNFSLGIEVFEAGNKKEEEYANIPIIDSGEVLSKEFSLSVKSFDRLCTVTKKDKKEYERECFDVDLKSLTDAYDVKTALPVNVKWGYNKQNSVLEVKLTKALINAKIILLENENTLNEDTVNSVLTSITKNYSVEEKNLTLVVDDLDVKKQQVFDIKLNSSTDLSNSVSDIAVDENGNILDAFCGGVVCESGFVCNGGSYKTAQGDCCRAECIPLSSGNESEKILPFIVVTAILIAIVAILIILSTYKRVKK